jgi:hypothetical protein
VLREEGGALLLEVVVGGIALSSVRVRLTAQEAEAYAREGTAFTDRLASEIMAEPSFGGRAFDGPDG